MTKEKVILQIELPLSKMSKEERAQAIDRVLDKLKEISDKSKGESE